MRKNQITLVSTLTFLCAVVFLAACSNEDKQTLTGKTLHFSSQDFLVTQGNLQTAADGSITGSGMMYAVLPVSKKQLNFSIPMTLESGQVVTLVAFANSGLAQGVELNFTAVDNKLKLYVQQPNGTLSDESASLQGLQTESSLVGQPIELSVDLHADHGHGGVYLNGTLMGEEFHFSKSIGGSFWGLKIQGAQVKSATVRDALEQD